MKGTALVRSLGTALKTWTLGTAGARAIQVIIWLQRGSLEECWIQEVFHSTKHNKWAQINNEPKRFHCRVSKFFFQLTTFLPENTDWSNWEHLPECINIVQAFAEKLLKIFMCGGVLSFFFPHLLLTVLFYSCYTFIPHLVQAFGLKHRIFWAGVKPGALWVKYSSFVKFCFPAHSKNQTMSDDKLVPGPLPASHQTKS